MTFTNKTFGRRDVLLAMAASTLALAAGRADALTTAQAKSLIDRVVGDINRVINSGKAESAMFRDFEGIFERYADVPTIARSTLGPPARSASQDQLNRYSKAFTGYLARKYGRRFREFIGGEVAVTNARQVKSFQEVQAVATLRGIDPFRISFMVSDRSGSDRFFDMLIEGISLLKAERAEVGALLDANGRDIDRLINALNRAG